MIGDAPDPIFALHFQVPGAQLPWAIIVLSIGGLHVVLAVVLERMSLNNGANNKDTIGFVELQMHSGDSESDIGSTRN